MVTAIETSSSIQTQKGIGEKRIIRTVNEDDAPLYLNEVLNVRDVNNEYGVALTMRGNIKVPKPAFNALATHFTV